jgi:hypothetical protein
MKSKFFFFGAVVFFLFSLFVFFFVLAKPRFVGTAMKSAGLVAVKQVEHRNVTAAVVCDVDKSAVENVNM